VFFAQHPLSLKSVGMKRTPLLFVALLLIVSSCTKKEYITEINHVNQTIDNNVPPPYDGVTTIQIQTYINKTYIDLLGREPLDTELDDATQMLRDGGLDENARVAFLKDLMEQEEYFDRFWEIYNSQYLGNVTADFLSFQISLYYQVYLDAIQAGDQVLANALLMEIDRFQLVLDASTEYADGLISINELMRRIADNPVYDEINMGSENFVIACFENFFKRSPTEAELPAAVTMVDGFSSQLLLSDGISKDDFLEIILHNPEFYQGLAIDIYQQLLSRLPDSIEMGLATTLLTETGTYQELQRQLMISEEYVGF
jgi:hypothetical protein